MFVRHKTQFFKFGHIISIVVSETNCFKGNYEQKLDKSKQKKLVLSNMPRIKITVENIHPPT